MIDGKAVRKKLIGSNEERAVSPVIGVILMVAITVILAAVIAAFVLDMSPGGDSAPQANYNWNSDGEEVTVTHQSGDDINLNQVNIKSSEVSNVNTDNVSDEFSVGDTLYFWYDGSSRVVVSDSSGDDPSTVGDASNIGKITLVYDSGDSGSILTEYEP